MGFVHIGKHIWNIKTLIPMRETLDDTLYTRRCWPTSNRKCWRSACLSYSLRPCSLSCLSWLVFLCTSLLHLTQTQTAMRRMKRKVGVCFIWHCDVIAGVMLYFCCLVVLSFIFIFLHSYCWVIDITFIILLF